MEAFPAFSQSFRTLYLSVMTASTSATIASAIIYSNLQNPSVINRSLFLIEAIAFIATVLLLAWPLVRGLWLESREGESTDAKSPREVNRIRAGWAIPASVAFVIGMLMFGGFIVSIAF